MVIPIPRFDIYHLLLIIIIFILFIIQTPESRHFIGLKIRKKNISFISMNPTGGIKLKKLVWNGEYFEHGKDSVFFGFDLLSNPHEDSAKKYNDVLKQASYWVDSRIPVLMGHESICFISNPQFVSLLQKARDNKKTDDNVLEIIKKLESMLEPATSRIIMVEPFSPSILTEYIQSSTAAEEYKSYEAGKIARTLEMTRPKLAAITKFAIPIAMIVMLLILWQSGALEKLLGSLKGFGK